jgi:hypothetical protein
MEVAKQNLYESSWTYSKVGEHLYAFMSGDNYDAARLLLTERIQDLEVAGQPVAS